MSLNIFAYVCVFYVVDTYVPKTFYQFIYVFSAVNICHIDVALLGW